MNSKQMIIKNFGYLFPYSFLELLIVLFTSFFISPQFFILANNLDHVITLDNGIRANLSVNTRQKSKWFYPKEAIHSLAIVTHGLNLRPGVMNQLIEVLNNKGVLVLRLSLAGHTSNKLEQETVKLSQWINNYLHAIDEVLKKKKQLELKYKKQFLLYSLSYSLGSVIHLNAMVSIAIKKKKLFKHNIMLAPAAWPKWYTLWAKALFFLPDDFSIYSANHPLYRAWPTTSLACYRSLYQAQEKWQSFEQRNNLELIGPLTILIDPQDELISLTKILSFSHRHPELKLDIIKLEQSKPSIEPHYHHLIIDKPTNGTTQWELIRKEIEKIIN